MLGVASVAVVLLSSCATLNGTARESDSTSRAPGVGERTTCGRLAEDAAGHIVVAEGNVSCDQANALMNRVFAMALDGGDSQRKQIDNWLCFIGPVAPAGEHRTMTSAFCASSTPTATVQVTTAPQGQQR
ncbi:hypothetical protein ACWDPV_01695 [Gordonia sp. NPDC003504]